MSNINKEVDKCFKDLNKRYSDKEINNAFTSYITKRMRLEIENESTSEIHTNLALFSKAIKNVKNCHSSLLFFATEDEIEGTKLLCHCIFCNVLVHLELQPTFNADSLKNHIVTCHPFVGNFFQQYRKNVHM